MGIVFINIFESLLGASQMVLEVKHLPANAAEIRTVGLIPGSGRSPGAESANPLQYSCLGKPIDRGNWRAIVHGVAKEFDKI